jgi:VanZ family protein
MVVKQIPNRVIWFAKFWLPVLICMLFIFCVSSLPGKDIPALFPFQDILFHGSIYAVLGLFFSRALKNTRAKLSLSGLVIATVIFGFLYGASDEFHQLFIPGRSCSGFDLLVDTCGSLIGSLVGSFLA